MALDFYQIIYDDSQREKCYPFAKIYFNSTLTIFFENSIIADLVMASNDEKISVCSWKLKEKMRWYIGVPREITQELLESDYDVLSFTKNTRHHFMLAAAEQWHKGFKDILRKVCNAIGVYCPEEVKIPIYQNHFSAKREIYQDYCENYLIPAMNVMILNEEINELVMLDSNYSELDKSKPEKLDLIEKQIGVRYYPMAPFILERLFSVFVHNKNINVSWL